ncbi:MAG TPA: hypothetical protein VLV86_03420, partial [Vicinamibacterales bacterium]|nr:hypothetical protein [Vicinamibacterales bacterium]
MLRNARITGRRSALATVLGVACLIASGAAQQAPRDTSALPAQTATTTPTGKLSGRVVAADTGRPIKRARVFISAAELPGGRGMLTEDDGT